MNYEKIFDQNKKKKLKKLAHTIGKYSMFLLTIIEKIINIFGF